MPKLPKLSNFSDAPQGRPSAIHHALQQAAFAIQMNEFTEAERIAADVLKSSRTNPAALQMFAFALMQQGRANDAIAPLEKALRREDSPGVETQLAVALRAAGRPDDALVRLRSATTRRPPHAPAFQELAQQLVALRRFDEAIDVLKQGETILPDVTSLSVQLGYLFARQSDRASARAAFLQALSKDANCVDAMRGLAYALQADGEHAQSADVFRRLLGIDPEDVDARIGLGTSLLELAQSEQAYQCFQLATRRDERMLGSALSALAGSARGRFWLRPSDAVRFVRGETR